ncbi:MAG: HTH-type transcriptional regulator CymR [Phycisphaerae bacterium]|nr:HTH-type transcriptional regulator CymR [Phycisphaerae bacterium]
MRLSKRSEYGLRAAVQLAASYKEGYLQTRELSRRENLPNKFLESILRSMKSAGLLVSKVGASGGYRLAESPEQISLGALLRSLEGQLVNPELLDRPHDPANTEAGAFALHLLALRVEGAIRTVIDSLTLAELLDESRKARGDAHTMFYI